MFFYIYVLQSVPKDVLYTGYTHDLRVRFEEHQHGRSRSTKPYLPWRLIYYEACLDEEDAKRRERYLKTTQGMRLLKRRLREYFFHQRSAA